MLNNNKKMGTIKPYSYIFPAVFVLVFVKFYPIVKTIIYSFTNKKIGSDFQFIGLSNFIKLLNDKIFFQALSHNFILLTVILVEVILGVIIAMLIYQQTWGWQFYQKIIFLPVVLSVVVCGVIWTYFYSYDGIINIIFSRLGLGKKLWLADPNYALLAVMISIIWRDTGFAVVLFLARLMSIPSQLFEAAKVDGATWFQTIRYITIPQLWGIIQVFIILSIIGLFNAVFGYIYVMTGGGPGYSTVVMEYFIYQKAFGESQLGYASALAFTLFLITLVLGLLQLKWGELE